MNEPLRVAIAGCGGMSGYWLDILGKPALGVEVVGLSDIEPSRARERAEQHGLAGAAVDADLPRLLRDTQPDIVFDLTAPAAHHEVVLAALGAGCHVLGEKPLANSLAEAREMISAAKSAGRAYAVMQNRRYAEPIRRFRAMIASGAFGAPTTLHADFFTAPRFGGFRDEMRHVLLLDMAIHHFDAARFLLGGRAKAVLCHEWNPSNSWYAHGASAAAVFEMEDGAVFTYRGSWCADGLATSWECDWRAILERGSIRWNGGAGFKAERLVEADGLQSKYEEAAAPPVNPNGKDGGHEGCIREFLRCVREGGTPETNAQDNFHSLAMVFAAIRSAEQGCRVEVEDLAG